MLKLGIDATDALKTLNIIADKARRVDNVLGEVQSKSGMTFEQAKTVSRQSLGILSAIASATGTTVGDVIALSISGAFGIIDILTPIYAGMIATAPVNPWAAAQAVIGLYQIPLIIAGIYAAILKREELLRGISKTSMMLNQVSSLMGTLSLI